MHLLIGDGDIVVSDDGLLWLLIMLPADQAGLQCGPNTLATASAWMRAEQLQVQVVGGTMPDLSLWVGGELEQ